MKFQVKRVEFYSGKISYRLFEEGDPCDTFEQAFEKWKKLVAYHEVVLSADPEKARKEKIGTLVHFKDKPKGFFMCVGFVIEPIIDDGKARAYKTVFPIP